MKNPLGAVGEGIGSEHAIKLSNNDVAIQFLQGKTFFRHADRKAFVAEARLTVVPL